MRKNGAEKSQTDRWGVADAKVNIAALLNDPRKARRDYDLFTKTWGEGFRDLPSKLPVPERHPTPLISWNSFSNYLGQTRDKFLRHQSQVLPTDQDKSLNEPQESARWQDPSTKYTSKSYPNQHRADTKAAAKHVLISVPKIFLIPNFQLDDKNTFVSVMSLDEQQHKSHDRNIRTSSKLLQEKLSHYLDIVEVAIVKQISARSDAFFDEMVSQENLNEHLKKLTAQVRHMRDKMAVTKSQMSRKFSKVLHLKSKLKNKEVLLEMLHIMSSVHQAQPTIQLLLSTNEYSGAFDLIETTQQVLKEELAGIHCFRHLSSQLLEIEKVISHMMKDELSKCIQSELQRPLSEGHYTVNPNHLISIALGLLRRRQLVFLEEFHEGIKVSVKAAIKMTVMDAVTLSEGTAIESDHDDSRVNVNGVEVSPQKVETLAEKMRKLTFDEWFEMLKNVFDNMNIFLQRIKSFLTVIVTVVQMSSTEFVDDSNTPNGIHQHDVPTPSAKTLSDNISDRDVIDHIDDEIGDVIDDMDQYEMRLMEAARSTSQILESASSDAQSSAEDCAEKRSDSGTSDPNQFLSREEHDELMLLVCQSMLWAADFCHDRCAKLIIAKNKNSSLDKLGAKDFLSYLQLVKEYVSDTEVALFEQSDEADNFTGDARYFSDYLKSSFGNTVESSSPLRGVLQSHVSIYIGRFHEERRNKLSLIIDNENWKQAEVPAELSRMFKELFSFNAFGSKSESVDAAMSSTLTVDGVRFCVVGTVLLLFKIVADYIQCANDLPHSVPDLSSRVSELLTYFNSRTCQLVLGAGALKTVGLKTISTKNLGLASRCLQLVLHLIPSLKSIFESKTESSLAAKLGKSHPKGLRCFDHVSKAYIDHIAEIDSKLISILDSVVESCLLKWQVKAPVPSKEVRTISRQIVKFHETIYDLLPGEQIRRILLEMHHKFQLRLKLKLKQFDVKNDGGPKFGLVMSDIAFYQKSLLALGVLTDGDLNIESVWR